jgi:hypothetical protein
MRSASMSSEPTTVGETAECGSMSSMPLQAPIRGSRANKMILCNDFMIVGFRK